MANVIEILIQGRDQFSGPAQRISVEAKGLGGTMGGLGKTVLGVAGGFIAAQASIAGVQKIMSSTVGAAMAYEHQLAVIRALTGATKGDTDTLKVSIREMQKTLPKSSAELGAGAYFILSSGIKDVATATKVLELSAKASTIGLGETGIVASVLTSIMNAYQLQAKDAAKATDTLVNIVKFGKGEPTEFAQSLGRVIPIAAQMGIEFEQVGAVLATLTNTGLDVAESVTALRGIMVQILKPTDESREKFAELGFDVVAFRKELDENFIGAMARLSRTVGEDEEAWATLFPEVRGMIGVMAAFSNQLPQTEQNLAGITGGVGALDAGFKEVSDTTQFKLQKAMNDLNVQLQEMGAGALPVVAASIEIIAQELHDLATPIRLVIDGYKLLKVATGAAGDASDDITDRIRKQVSALREMGASTDEQIVALGGWKRALADSEGDVRSLGAEMGFTDAEIERAVDLWRRAVGAIGEMQNVGEVARVELGDIAGGLRGVGMEAQQTSQLFKDFTSGIQGGLRSVMPTVSESFGEWETRLTDLAQDYSDMEGNLQTIMGALVNQHVRGVDDIMAVVRNQGPQFAADFAQWFRDDPIAAAETLQQVMPGIMREAAQKAITNVIEATSRFNEAWQTNVIGALNKLPPEKRVSILADVDPDLWLAAAVIAQIQGGIDVSLAQRRAVIQAVLAASAIGAQHGFHGTVDQPTLIMAGEAGRERVDITPGGSQVVSGASGGSATPTYNINLTFTGPVLGDQHQANELAQWLLPALRGALR